MARGRERDAAMSQEQARGGGVRPGEVLMLRQHSARRREYELRRGELTVGWLHFPPGRRSVALAEADATGSMVLTAGSRGVDVRGGPEGATPIAAVERGDGGVAVIRTAQGRAFGWHRSGRWHRWAIDDGDATLLRFAASQRLVKSSVRITAEHPVAVQAQVLGCLVGAFLALRSLQAGVDGSSAVGGIVASGAG
jgi:hypothetical protein